MAVRELATPRHDYVPFPNLFGDRRCPLSNSIGCNWCTAIEHFYNCHSISADVNAIINPRRACAAKVIVVVLCVCMYPLISAASHIGITKERYQRVHSNAGIVLNFTDFPKNASFKSYGVICLPRAAPASLRLFRGGKSARMLGIISLFILHI